MMKVPNEGGHKCDDDDRFYSVHQSVIKTNVFWVVLHKYFFVVNTLNLTTTCT